VFEELFGLPAHPLLVHAPVVLIPVTALMAVAYGLVPPLRRQLSWFLVLFALASAGSAYAASESGKAFATKLGGATPTIAAHQNLGETLRNVVFLLAAVAVVLVIVDRARRRRGLRFAPGASPHTYASSRSGGVVLSVVSVILTLGLLATSGTAAFYVVRTGHTGAEMVWGTR
jgi:uncharacterized membrane protein